MSAYISTLDLIENTVASESSEAGTFDDYCEGASRLFDMLCEVEENFFAKASSEESAKTFYGGGIDMLRLPPFVAGSVTEILIDDEAFETDSYRVQNGYLYNLDGDFDAESTIVITAKWGFAAIPAGVKIVVQELANYLYRNRDPMFTKMSDVESQLDLSPMSVKALKRFRDLYSQGAY